MGTLVDFRTGGTRCSQEGFGPQAGSLHCLRTLVSQMIVSSHIRKRSWKKPRARSITSMSCLTTQCMFAASIVCLLLNIVSRRSSFDSLDGTLNQLASLVLRNALDSQKKLEEKLSLESSQMETDDTDILRVQCQVRLHYTALFPVAYSSVQKRIDEAMEFCLTKVRSPNYLLQLSNELAQRGEYELLLKMAAQCQLRIKEMNTLSEERLVTA